MIRVTGHFGEWIQGRLGPGGPLVLVTVACPALCARARRLGDGPLAITQDPELIAPSRAAAFLARIGAGAGRFALSATMPPGGGAGSSTAALLALAGAAGARLPPETLAAACVAVEGASDPLMLDHPDSVLWNPRQARVVATLPPLPLAEIVGGFWGTGCPTDPADLDFDDISDLARGLAVPVPLDRLAAVASDSADRCSARRGPGDDPASALCRDLGALGYLRAHTGSARGFIFPPGAVPAGAEAALAEAGFHHIVRFRTGGPR